mmetsp:Transcript_9608/g.26139  ORF Transcript_9608/g.26139 Transcript_9608/m.26139 type:complete len:243 (+) Transcript_9608:1254-1982(+)
MCLFLVDVSINSLTPVVDTLWEPHLELVSSGLRRVASVADVASQVDGEVSADAAWLGGQWLGLAEHLASLTDDVLALPAHADDWSAAEELGEAWVERLLGQVGIVGLGHFQGWPDHLQADELVSALFETGDDITDDSALHTVRLDSKEGALLVGACLSVDWKGVLTEGDVVGLLHEPGGGDGTGSHQSHEGLGGGGRSDNLLGGSGCRERSDGIAVGDAAAEGADGCAGEHGGWMGGSWALT